MVDSPFAMMDGNDAVASVAYRTNDVIAIYPITPASPMGELADGWSGSGKANIWGDVPEVVEMQSEGGAAGAIHGALQAGAVTTSFTASQGLLLMLPNMYKIAGELTPFCLHVAARTVATHALSIFGDHSDVMAARPTGFAMLASSSVQEAHDAAAIAQAATLRGRVPLLHFFDGFRTSHEINRVEVLTDDDLRFLIDDADRDAHRARALRPDHPVIRGTAQNPDTFFQAREASNPWYDRMPDVVQDTMDAFATRTGRAYHLFDYAGAPDAEHVIVIMGSGAETVRETVSTLGKDGARVGVVTVRLYRPFATDRFIAALPPTVRRIAVLDRTKEPGAGGDPLLLDVVSALTDARQRGEIAEVPFVVGGRYGLASKEFTPAMVRAVFEELTHTRPRARFTVGIHDDVGDTSLPIGDDVDLEPAGTVRALFYGLGSDGTVGANKNSIKIIGAQPHTYAQGYFVYDSKKAGAMTISHLRFGPAPIRAPYLIGEAEFVAVHQWDLLFRLDVLAHAAPGATVLLNAPFVPAEVWPRLPREVQTTVIERRLRLFAIDAQAVARQAGLGVRINTIMQTCFFDLTDVLSRDDAIREIKRAIERTYGSRGPVVVARNHAAVDASLAGLHEVTVPTEATAAQTRPPLVPATAPEHVHDMTAVLLAHRGDTLPVSAFPVDGTWPVGTTQWEKRNLATEIPIWDPAVCIQCNWCAIVCPHAAIRAKVYDPALLDDAPAGFRSTPFRGPDLRDEAYTLQVAPEDCTGCHLCVTVCPAKDKSNPRHKAIDMTPQAPIRDREREAYAFFLDLPEVDRTQLTKLDTRHSQLLQPLFEYSGACAGCGETPYLKLLTQLFGDRLLIANATGCSSIYGGNLPTTPYTTNRDGRGPAWANSLFEDNAEFGFGMRLAVDAQRTEARQLLERHADRLGPALVADLVHGASTAPADVAAQRERIARVRAALPALDPAVARRLDPLLDGLVPTSVWLVGGDGWAYDIGYGGLDHVLAQRRNVNVLVLDTEVYSNTGGQQSKATPLGAAAKFAARGKDVPKKDLGLEAMSYGHVYVAQVALGANMNQTVKAFLEADAHPGPSLIIANSPCIAHGYDLRHSAEQQKLAVQSGACPLYRFDPARAHEGEPPLHLDAKAPSEPLERYFRNEMRFRMVEQADPQRFADLVRRAQHEVSRRAAVYAQLAAITIPQDDDAGEGP